MFKQPTFIQSCPDDNYFVWQTHAWLESLKKHNKSEGAVSLVFTPADRKSINSKWEYLKELYPEAIFRHYHDKEGKIFPLLSLYAPIIRLYSLTEYFKELGTSSKECSFFYCDADVIFTESFNIDSLLNDNVCYVSNTLSYINASYFDSKIRDVIPQKESEYRTRDILQECTEIVGISREIAEKNNDHSGGAQYLLKGIDFTFWEKAFIDCINIRKHLLSVNRKFFHNENRGFQSWTADMWAVLWNLWYIGKEVRVVPEMDFIWSTDSAEKVAKCGIFHNAGVTGKYHGKTPMFYKGDYANNNKTPFSDGWIESIVDNPDNKNLANNYYIKFLIELKQKYNLK